MGEDGVLLNSYPFSMFCGVDFVNSEAALNCFWTIICAQA